MRYQPVMTFNSSNLAYRWHNKTKSYKNT